MRNVKKPLSSYVYEIEAWKNNNFICGIDEVGRGCLAGPVVICAAILNQNAMHEKLTDSKLLSPKELLDLYSWLKNNCKYAISIKNVFTIDRKNIYQTTKEGMKQAVIQLLHQEKAPASAIIVDAMPLNLHGTPWENIPILSMPQAELASASVAAASVLAKVTRDMMMQQMDASFPSYGLAKHKGYGTKQHTTAIVAVNSSIIHRKSYIKNIEQKIKESDEQHQQTFC